MFAIQRHALKDRAESTRSACANVTFKSIASRSLPVCSCRSHFPCHACHAGSLEGLGGVGNEYSVVSEAVHPALVANKGYARGIGAEVEIEPGALI